MARTKISVVRYVNSVPLAWGILEGPQRELFEPVLSTPAECADQLAAGAVDIGLIPSIEYHRIKGGKIVPGPAIACRHRVRSVLLLSELPLFRIRSVACDRGSRSSVALAKIVLDEFYGNRPEFRPAEPDLAAMLAQNDAALIIGDIALKFSAEHTPPDAEKQKHLLRHGPEPLQVFDLVERWKVLTGLPFVFAFWAARSGFKDSGVVDQLKASRDLGLRHIPDIAARHAGPLGLPEGYVRDYLENNVDYHMDEACVRALELFYAKAARIGAVSSGRDLEFL